jgi:uncharacterized protein (TIGR03435 family)
MLQNAFSKPSAGPGGLIEIIGGPSWMDSDRYDIQATVDCSGGVLSREQFQLMFQSMLEDRFQLKAHMEARELPVYNLVVAKDGPKLKASADQTPVALSAGGPPLPCSPASAAPNPAPLSPPTPREPGRRGGMMDPSVAMPRGLMGFMLSSTGIAIRGSAVTIANLSNALQQQVGRPIIDKTNLKGLFDFTLQFSTEGLSVPGLLGGGVLPQGTGAAGVGGPLPAPPTAAVDPVPSLFTAIQELGLRLESSKGPGEVIFVDSAQRPTQN